MITIKLKKGDLFITVAIVLMAAAILMYNDGRSMNDGELRVEVRVDGEIVDDFSLKETIKKEYHTEFGFNLLIIEKGEVYIQDADCLTRSCIMDGHRHLSGEALVCLPNRFTIEIIGEEGGDVDAISQ